MADAKEAPAMLGPTEDGNRFDVRMSEQPDGVEAAKMIANIIKRKGYCVVEANAPHDLLEAAYEEAEELWEDGEFDAPIKVGCDRELAQARVWARALRDEEKVLWVKKDSEALRLKNALKLLSDNMRDFGGGLLQYLQQGLGLKFDNNSMPMVSCYNGDRQYDLHLDNIHGTEDQDACESGSIDNGMRLTMSYYINPHWDPDDDRDCPGGLDVFLTDPSAPPPSSAEARQAGRLRLAPHADTLVIFLSEKIAHQVVATTREKKWFCLNLWFMDKQVMERIPTALQNAARVKPKYGDSDEEDGPD